MDISSACLVGGTGFVGRSVADQLSPLGVRLQPALEEIRSWASELEPVASGRVRA